MSDTAGLYGVGVLLWEHTHRRQNGW